MSEKKNIIISGMDTELWKKFKIVCIKNDKKITDVMANLVDDYVRAFSD
jgi:hypothetical protein